MIRLDRFLNGTLHLGRTGVRRLIRSGAVTVDGQVVRQSDAKVEPGANEIAVDGRPLEPPGELYLMLHKPAGILCSTRDARHRTVLDLLPEEIALRAPHAAGRLDLDATGLVLLTTDGAWSHLLTSPRRLLAKIYDVRLSAPITTADVEAFAAGIVLRGETRPTAPAGLEPLPGGSPDAVRVTLTEGRYHQIKRMFGALGNHVTAIHRTMIGPLALDPTLPPGGFRPLSSEEILRLGAGPEIPVLPTDPHAR